jgi:hypothetical protein
MLQVLLYHVYSRVQFIFLEICLHVLLPLLIRTVNYGPSGRSSGFTGPYRPFRSVTRVPPVTSSPGPCVTCTQLRSEDQ